jgi:VWFA-related protein
MNVAIRLRRVVLIGTFGFTLFAVPASGQVTPQQKPAEQSDEVVRIKTNLVQTTVMVFDTQNRFVEGLQREQFELTVDGQPHPISFLEQIRTGSAREELQLEEASGSAKPSPKRNTTPPVSDRGRTVVFLVDDLHLSLGSLERTRKMLSHFVADQMGKNDQVAIASTSGQIGFLQQFTDNTAVLRAAIARLVHKPYAARDLNQQGAPMTEFMALTIERKDDPGVFDFYVDECLKYNPPPLGIRLNRPRAACEMQVVNRARSLLVQAASIISNTYTSIESLMRSTAQRPGRKLVFLVSDGFLLDTGPRNADPRGRLGRITDEAQRAGVVIYTIDARGFVSGLLDATNNVPFDMNGRLESAAMREIPASQDALNALAEDTGGRALRNQNVFDPFVNKTLEETSNYYLLAWRPGNEEQTSTNFRNLKVSVTGHPEYTVRLPRGYMSTGPTPVASHSKVQPVAKTTAEELREALGAFYPKRDLPTSLSLIYLDTPEHGLVLTASVQIASEALKYDVVNGKQTAGVDLAGVVLNDKGKQAGSFETHLNISGLAAGGATSRFGTIYNYRLPVKPGIYQVRVAARDGGGGYVGSNVQWIEKPDLATTHLTLSSLVVGIQDVEPSKATSPASATPQMQFSVDHRFVRNSHLRFLVFVYNAGRGVGATRLPDVVIQSRILRENQLLVTTPESKVTAETEDPTRMPYGAELTLHSLAPGNYVLQVLVIDRIAKASAVQETKFTIE